MAVKGFNVGGSINRYDFGSLDNVTGAAGYSVANNLTTAASGSAVLDAHQGKVLSDTLSAMNVLTSNTEATVSVTDSTWTTIGSISHGKGLYLIIATCSFASRSSNGMRWALVTASNGSATAAETSLAKTDNPVAGYGCRINLFGVINATASGAWFLRAFQTSGVSLDTTGDIKIVKLS